MKMAKLCLVMAVATFAGAGAGFAQVKIEEKVMGRAAPRTEAYTISTKGVHYAVLTPKGTRKVMVVDGVEGPEFDVFLGKRGGQTTSRDWVVVFSPDGSRHAYMAVVGKQYILVVDGKEMYRGELGLSGGTTNLGYSDMQFSPGGKHVYFVDLKPSAEGRARALLVMDGKAGPPSGHQTILPAFSPDDSRWAYVAIKFGGRQDEYISVVDGKEIVPFVGFNPVFTADNKLLTSLQNRASDPAVVAINGKPTVNGVSTGGKIGAAPAGSRWAGVMQPKKAGDSNVLYIDGKEVPEAQNVEEVFFSPDGKRYMALCSNRTTRAKYVALDGKKGPEYQVIDRTLVRFSRDSSRAAYIGNNLGKNFVVVDGQPSEGYVVVMGQTNKIALSQRGGHYGYLPSNGVVAQALIIDGKPVPLNGINVVPDTLGFSADGRRYAFVAVRPGQGVKRFMVVDGVEVPGITVNENLVGNNLQGWWSDAFGVQSKFYQFSPDGKHIFFTGTRASNNHNTVFVDGKPVFSLTVGSTIEFVSWSPDSKHLFWAAQEATGPQTAYRVFVDGKPTSVKFGPDQPTVPGVWQIGADGTLQFLVWEGAVTKRYRITPGSDASIETALAGAK